MRARLTLPVLMLLTLGSGCNPDEEANSDEPPCEMPTETDLGWPFRSARTAFFETSGGDVFVAVNELTDGVLGKVRQTAVDIGPGGAAPKIDPASSLTPGTEARSTVHLERLSKVSLAAGSYWLVSSDGGRITLHTCPDVEITHVRPATGDRGGSFTSPVSSATP
jgi:hypothetical protein